MSGAPALRGSLLAIGPDYTMKWTAAQFDSFLDDLVSCGLDTVVTIQSADNAWGDCYYPSKKWRQSSELVPLLMSSAEKRGVKVWLGLSNWSGAISDAPHLHDRAFMTKYAQDNVATANELRALYGKSPSFAGFYIPDEVGPNHLNDTAAGAQENLKLYFDGICAGGPGPYMCSPTFWEDVAAKKPMGPAEFAKRLMSAVGACDVIAPQDGAGWGVYKNSTKPITDYFAALKAEIHGALWQNTDMFDTTLNAPRSPADRRAQWAACDGLVTGRIGYAFDSSVRPDGDGDQTQGSDYWLQALRTDNVGVSSSARRLASRAEAMVQPVLVQPVSVTATTENPGNKEVAVNLIDGTANTKWLGRAAQAAVTLDMGSPVPLGAYYLMSAWDSKTYPSWDPKAWMLEASADGTDWFHVDERVDQAFGAPRVVRKYAVAGDPFFRYYRFTFTNGGGPFTQLTEIAFLAAPPTPPPPPEPTVTETMYPAGTAFNIAPGDDGQIVLRVTTP